jgi:uncharacterized Zn finger protein
MSRPRKPFGPNPPGRLAATMIKVLAAEMSEPARLTRGKRYWSDNAVIDLLIGHGAVTAEVQGSLPVPYVVTLETLPGREVPSRRELTVWCTCPDHDPAGRAMCKHAVAAMFALSDEVATDPAVLARWRRSDQLPATLDRPDDTLDERATDPLAEVLTGPLADPLAGPLTGPLADPLAEVLGLTGGPVMPPMPVLSDLQHPRPAPRPVDQLVAAVLDDALANLGVRWD